MGGRDPGDRGYRANPSVVSDASPLIALERIGRLNLLEAVYGRVLVPPAVRHEAGPAGAHPWIVEHPPRHPLDRRLVAAGLGAGETEAIALALEGAAVRILMDDGPARRVASSYGLVVVGTAGVLLTAKRLMVLPSVRPTLERLLATGFHLRPDIVENILFQAGETKQDTESRA